MDTISIAYDIAGTGVETLIGEVAGSIGTVTLNDVVFEAGGHHGPMLSGTLRVITGMGEAEAQDAVDDIAADFLGNGFHLWASVSAR